VPSSSETLSPELNTGTPVSTTTATSSMPSPLKSAVAAPPRKPPELATNAGLVVAYGEPGAGANVAADAPDAQHSASTAAKTVERSLPRIQSPSSFR
jgi:hypothetical protein